MGVLQVQAPNEETKVQQKPIEIKDFVSKPIMGNVDEQEQEEEEDIVDVDDDDDDENEEEVFMESINNILDIKELKNQYIAFYKSKESEIYELKNKFTEISRRQKEVFMEVENRRKLAASKGKKYKQTAQKYHYQTQKITKDL